MAGKKITELNPITAANLHRADEFTCVDDSEANLSDKNKAITVEELVKLHAVNLGTGGGAANAHTLTTNLYSASAYVAEQHFIWEAGFTNTTTATLNINGIGATTIKYSDGSTDLQAGAITAGRYYYTVYDGTNMVLVNVDVPGSTAVSTGAWTPTVQSGPTLVDDDGRYVKIGDYVTVNFYISWASSALTGAVRINNLPYTPFGNDWVGSALVDTGGGSLSAEATVYLLAGDVYISRESIGGATHYDDVDAVRGTLTYSVS